MRLSFRFILRIAVLVSLLQGSCGPAFSQVKKSNQKTEGKGSGSFKPDKFFGAPADHTNRATPAESLRLPKGFKAQLLYTVPLDRQGSWVCLTTDQKGRLIASAESGKLYRITPPPLHAVGVTKVEPINLEIGNAQGLLCAFDSLYVVMSSDKSGLYRVRDTDGDDQYDTVELLRRFEGRGEHGPHAVLLAPAGDALYLVGGNESYPNPPPDTSAFPTNWKEDRLQKRIGASDGAFGRKRPGGWVCRTDPQGKNFTLVAMGLRNPYDLVFNAEGELFTFDSDMEWDAGTPWYRPTRINHVTHGADFGWRAGTAKWPDDYLDSLGSVVDIGFSSPTGLTFGQGAKFPARYQKALFAGDWSYGNIYAIHLEPDGASYKGTAERFISGSPLPVTDIVIRPQDGALYFLIGGRRTTSALYRVIYEGPEPTGPTRPGPDSNQPLRELRKRIETGNSLDLAWPNLGHKDRSIRFAARIALERQPIRTWRERFRAESDPRTTIAAAVALARQGGVAERDNLLDKLGKLDWKLLSVADRLDLLRAYELAALRPEPTDEATCRRIVASLRPHYPSGSDRLDRELAEVLTSLKAPDVIAPTLDCLERAGAQELQIHFVMCLREIRNGWSLPERRRLLRWFIRAQSGGVSFGEYMETIREEMIKQLDERERNALADLLRAPPSTDPHVELKRRPIIQKRTVDNLLPLVERGGGKGDRVRGKKVFSTALCFRCHRIAGQGGMVGPDLTGISGRFNVRDLVEAIVEPSRVVPDQYRMSVITLKNGRTMQGKIKDVSGNRLLILRDPLKPADLLMIDRDTVEEVAWSKLSMMPEGLLDSFTNEEILDLFTFLKDPIKDPGSPARTEP